jgi:hypothetical protein
MRLSTFYGCFFEAARKVYKMSTPRRYEIESLPVSLADCQYIGGRIGAYDLQPAQP